MVALWIVIKKLQGSISIKECVAFFLGAVFMATVFVGLELSLFGLQNLQDSYAFAKETAKGSNFNPSFTMRLERLLVWFPKNLSLYFLLAPPLLALCISMAVLKWKHMSPAVQLASLITVGYFLFSFSFPLIYWKRLLLIAPCALIILYGIATSSQNSAPKSHLSTIALSLSAVLSVLWGVSGLMSDFSGMWRVIPFWKTTNAYLSFAILSGLALISMFLVWKRQEMKVIRFGLMAVCLSTIGLGVKQLAIPKVSAAKDIGRSISALTDGQSVVSDHQAFRFFAYYSNSSVMFTHENDPGFPQQIYDNISYNQPDYVVVSDSYSFDPNSIEAKFPHYSEVSSFSHEHSQSKFLSKPYKVEIKVFKNTSNQPSSK